MSGANIPHYTKRKVIRAAIRERREALAMRGLGENDFDAAMYGLRARKRMERPAFRIREAYDKLLQRCGL